MLATRYSATGENFEKQLKFIAPQAKILTKNEICSAAGKIFEKNEIYSSTSKFF
jgi:hypothetical protein